MNGTRLTWEPMSLGSGQTTGDTYGLHAYAHRKTPYTGQARWYVYWGTSRIDKGYAPTLREARAAAEACMERCSSLEAVES